MFQHPRLQKKGGDLSVIVKHYFLVPRPEVYDEKNLELTRPPMKEAVTKPVVDAAALAASVAAAAGGDGVLKDEDTSVKDDEQEKKAAALRKRGVHLLK